MTGAAHSPLTSTKHSLYSLRQMPYPLLILGRAHDVQSMPRLTDGQDDSMVRHGHDRKIKQYITADPLIGDRPAGPLHLQASTLQRLCSRVYLTGVFSFLAADFFALTYRCVRFQPSQVKCR